MILGAHNTMTYLSPKQWYLKPFAFMAKCQSKNWQELIDNNVQWFDIRIYFDKIGNIEYRHGFFRYSANNLHDFLSTLNKVQDKRYYVRIMFEEPRVGDFNSNRNELIAKFKTLCSELEIRYPNIKFLEGRSIRTWEILYAFNNTVPVAEQLDLYSSTTSLFKIKWLDDWIPWLYAKLKNKNNLATYQVFNKLLIIDFV